MINTCLDIKKLDNYLLNYEIKLLSTFKECHWPTLSKNISHQFNLVCRKREISFAKLKQGYENKIKVNK